MGGCDGWLLTGACNPMVCPIHTCRYIKYRQSKAAGDTSITYAYIPKVGGKSIKVYHWDFGYNGRAYQRRVLNGGARCR